MEDLNQGTIKNALSPLYNLISTLDQKSNTLNDLCKDHHELRQQFLASEKLIRDFERDLRRATGLAAFNLDQLTKTA